MLKRSMLTCLAIGMVLSGVAWGDPRVTPVEQYDVRLHGAVFHGGDPTDRASSLLLLVSRAGDGWQLVLGTTRDYNIAVHTGHVRSAKIDEKSFAMSADVKVWQDARSSAGGYASYTLDLSRQEDGVWAGTYEGEYGGAAVRGKAEARKLPKHEEAGSSPATLRRDEHPRILFRASDLPALREKAETPLGQAAMKQMGGPVGLGVKYQLTGEEKHAMAAIPQVRKLMSRGLMSDQFGNNVGIRLEQTAMAYDLCFDAWPPEFKREVESYMLWAGNGILGARRDTHQGVNWHVSSNWSSPLYTGAAFAGMALWGHSGPQPTAPAPTLTGAKIPAAASHTPGKGVTVFDFVSDRMPGDWIYAGGFKTDTVDGEPLAGLGGPGKARPEVGSEVKFGGKTYRFAPVSREKDKGYWAHESYDGGKEMIDITNAVGREYFSTNYFYAVVKNDRPRWVRFDSSSHPARVYLNGVRLASGEVAHLEKGLYPMLVEAYIDQINPWGRQLMRPRLIEIDQEKANELIEQQQATHEEAMARWRSRVEEWKALDGMDLRYRDLFERSRHMMYMFCREAVGDGGAQSELTHYSGIAERPPAKYTGLHKRLFGYDVSPQPDMEMLLPRKIFVHVYGENGQWAQEINGTPKVDPELFAGLFPTVRDKWQRAMLWGWQRHAGFTGDGDWGKLLHGDPVVAWLHYPLDMKPQHPKGVLPLTWRADDFGLYGFRSGWEGRSDFVTQVWLKAHHTGGWNAPNAGTFRVMGLGHVWAAGSTDRNRHRWEESVVMLPGAENVRGNTGAQLMSISTYEDGSGVLSMDMDDVYAAQVIGENGRGLRPYSRYGSIRNDEAFGDSGITGMRSIGVDYSGASGAPCLIALVDRVGGAKDSVWVWQLPKPGRSSDGSESDVNRGETKGNHFVVRKPDGASMQGLFVTGQAPDVGVRMTEMKGRAGSSAGKTLARPIHGVFAEGGETYFVVVTIQKGEAPSIKVKGKGLDAVVTVGKQTVRFDGEKIVFGRAVE